MIEFVQLVMSNEVVGINDFFYGFKYIRVNFPISET